MNEINMGPNIPSQIEEPPMSRTHQYRKVMKPLLERKRRARINKCLDNIKDLLIDSLQTESGESITKLEKADVLELTLKHLQELQRQKKNYSVNAQTPIPSEVIKQHFNSGYKACAGEVSRYLESIPLPLNTPNLSSYHDSKPLNVNGAFGGNLMSHLGKHLQIIEMGPSFLPVTQQAPKTTSPLSVNTYCNDISKTILQLPSSSSSYGNHSVYHPSVPSGATPSHFHSNPSGRTLSSSSDCGYSSGRDSVSPHSLASTALSPTGGEIECPSSPKINVEDLDDEESAVDMTSPLNLVQRPLSPEGVWRPF